MKTIKKQIKLFGFILSLLILFQSCRAYHSKSVTLEQASQEFKRTKVQTLNGEVLKFKGILSENGQFFGSKKFKGQTLKAPLDPNYIKSVKLENKTASTILTVLLPITIIAGTILIFQDSFKWKTGSLYSAN